MRNLTAMGYSRKNSDSRGQQIIRTLTCYLAACLIVVLAPRCVGQQLQVLVDQVGYEARGPKQALIMGAASDHPQQFSLLDAATGKAVLSGTLTPAGRVHAWEGTYWIADFSSWQKPGHYRLQTKTAAGEVSSCRFEIADDVLERNTLSNVLYYFKGQRSSGLIDQADRHLPLPGGEAGFVDVHGGWYDATGDYGIHFSHQNLTSYFNPQQIPLVVWTLLKSYRALEARRDDNFTEYERRLLDEGLYGADFMVRMKRPNGSFFESIAAPGKGKLPQDREIGNPNWRTQIKDKAADSGFTVQNPASPLSYQVSFRSGGGMAIAALAVASTMPADGDFPRATYLRTAEEAFQFLETHNREMVNDGIENILDDYCALLAATELYKATHKETYLASADRRAALLMARLNTQGAYRDYWRADGDTRPYFHPSDAGLPAITLTEYSQIAAPAAQKQARETVERSLRFELAVTGEVNNPFGYARQLVRMGDGQVRSAFFFPHDTEAAPWWQGENARLASLAAAARLAAPLFAGDLAFQARLEAYAWNQLHWIHGRNPFDASMLMGTGHGNAPYMFFGSYKYASAPGSIINGITAALQEEDGIAFNLGYAVTGKDDDWRWTEQWLPHAAWYLYAVSLPH
jgi:hypothetical protein